MITFAAEISFPFRFFVLPPIASQAILRARWDFSLVQIGSMMSARPRTVDARRPFF